MFKKGEIVYHDNLIFSDGCIDKKEKRPCIVLFEFYLNDIGYVCTVPITSSVKSFNKKNGYKNHRLISQTIYSYKKLSFYKIDTLSINPIDETHKTNIALCDDEIKMLEKNIVSYEYKRILDILIKNFIVKQNKEEKKLKKIKRKELKREI